MIVLKKLRVTVVVAILTLGVQPSYSLEATQVAIASQSGKLITKNLRQAEAHNNRGVELAQQGRYQKRG